MLAEFSLNFKNFVKKILQKDQSQCWTVKIQIRSDALKISLSADNKIKLNSLHAKSHLGITFANRGSSGLNPNYKLLMVYLKEYFEKSFENNQSTRKKHAKLPSIQRV